MNIILKNFKRSITFSILLPLLVLLVLTNIVFYVVIKQRNLENALSERKQVDSTNALFQSALSEKIAIVASSSAFIDFITSGELSRKEILPKFLEQLSTIHSNSILGLTISNTERDDTFNYGNVSNEYITLNLCYLSNRLDSKYGKCNYLLKIYFSKNGLLEELEKINKELIICKKCELIDLFSSDSFGSFDIHDKSPFLIGLKIKEDKNNIYYYYFFIIFLLIIFALLNNARIHRIINNVISIPIRELVKNVKNDYDLEKSDQSLQEINYLIDQMGFWKAQIKASQEIEKRAVLLDLAAKVAHDICSPIVVMEAIVNTITKHVYNDDIVMLQESLNSIRDIANNLLIKYRQSDYQVEQVESCELLSHYVLLIPLLKLMILHKYQEWRSKPCEILLDVDSSVKFVWIKCVPNEMKRVLSNLLNNAYEALRESRQIIIKIKQDVYGTKLIIHDKGIGVSQDMIENVLQGVSSKHSGKGLGLCSAKSYIESIGGELKLVSEKNNFTEVMLLFPTNTSPIWFPYTIILPKNACVAILDDDASIHSYWKRLFENKKINLMHFSNSNDLINWYNARSDEKITFIVDYHLENDQYDGLTLLKNLKIKNAYLVTNQAEDSYIQKTVEEEGFWLIPKSLMGDVAITTF